MDKMSPSAGQLEKLRRSVLLFILNNTQRKMINLSPQYENTAKRLLKNTLFTRIV